MLRRLLVIILCLLSMAGAKISSAEEKQSLQAFLDKDSARIGERVVLTLKYSLPEGARLVDPPELKGIEALTGVGITKRSNELVLTFLVDGLREWKTGPISIYYLRGDGTKGELSADPVSLKVLSNLGEKPEEAELRPVYGIIPIRSWWRVHLVWILCAIGTLLAAGAIWWWYRKEKIKEIQATVISPYLEAKQAIEVLEGQRLFEKGYVKEFYFKCSEILRRYMEQLRGFPAPELTTEEIALKISEDQDRRVLTLLRHADLVKFADIVPTPARKEEEVREILSYLEETGQHL